MGQTTRHDFAGDKAELRRKAEDALETAATPDDRASPLPGDIQALVHDLRVHQIELELQNEALREAQAELEAAEERFRELYDQAPVGYCTVDEGGLVLEANLTVATLLGVFRGTLIGQRVQAFIPQPDKDAYHRFSAALFETRSPRSIDLRMVRADGERRVVRVDAVVKALDGAPVCLATLSDITGREDAERVRQSEEQFRKLFLSAKDALAFGSPGGAVDRVNGAFAAMHGYTIEELERMNVTRLFPPSKLAAFSSMVTSVLAGQTHTYETEHLHKSGRLVPVEVSVSKADFGDGPRFLAVYRDLTDRKRAAEVEAQLQQAQKLESVGRLAGGVAHDFNNMLTVVISRCDLAIELAGAESPVLEDLVEIRGAATRSAKLTRQLLALARKQPSAPVVLDLNESVAGMLGMLRSLVGESVALEWKPGAGLGPVRVDPLQLDQILANLCVNSRDAIDRSGRVTVETGSHTLSEANCARHVEAVPGEYVRLTVRDNGRGMDPTTLAHLFEPFFTTKPQGEGTGLGLATVHGVVTQHGGFLEVDSEPGAGTTVSVYLPRHPGEGPRVQAPVAARAAGGHETVLLVDDQQVLLKSTTRILERAGYHVLPASTPEAALRIAREHPGEIHLLVTDVVMPGMNGQELAEAVLAKRPDTRRLFMSGYTADIIARHGVLDDGVSFLQKPFAGVHLTAKVREALDSAAVVEPRAQATGSGEP